MIVSLCVIFIEITSNLSLLPQVNMLVLLVLKIVGDWLNDVVYQLHVQIKEIPFLEEHPLCFMQHLMPLDAIMGPLVRFLGYRVLVQLWKHFLLQSIMVSLS